MAIKFKCQECGREYSVNDKLAGKKLKCKNENCATPILVPNITESADGKNKKRIILASSISGVVIVIIVVIAIIISSSNYEQNNVDISKDEIDKGHSIKKKTKKEDKKTKETEEEKQLKIKYERIKKYLGRWIYENKRLGWRSDTVFTKDGKYVQLYQMEDLNIKWRGTWEIDEDILVLNRTAEWDGSGWRRKFHSMKYKIVEISSVKLVVELISSSSSSSVMSKEEIWFRYEFLYE